MRLRLFGKSGFALLALCWAAIITNFSTDKFSASHTAPYIETLLKWLLPWLSMATIHSLHAGIRKLAHFSEYGIFALLLFGIWAAGELRWRWRWLLYALAIVAAFALLDEYHQTFTHLRNASLADSLLDASGGLFALLMLSINQRKRFSADNKFLAN